MSLSWRQLGHHEAEKSQMPDVCPSNATPKAAGRAGQATIRMYVNEDRIMQCYGIFHALRGALSWQCPFERMRLRIEHKLVQADHIRLTKDKVEILKRFRHPKALHAIHLDLLCAQILLTPSDVA